MQLVLIDHVTAAPQIEALEGQSWGANWGAGLLLST